MYKAGNCLMPSIVVDAVASQGELAVRSIQALIHSETRVETHSYLFNFCLDICTRPTVLEGQNLTLVS